MAGFFIALTLLVIAYQTAQPQAIATPHKKMLPPTTISYPSLSPSQSSTTIPEEPTTAYAGQKAPAYNTHSEKEVPGVAGPALAHSRALVPCTPETCPPAETLHKVPAGTILPSPTLTPLPTPAPDPEPTWIVLPPRSCGWKWQEADNAQALTTPPSGYYLPCLHEDPATP